MRQGEENVQGPNEGKTSKRSWSFGDMGIPKL
jgi:hypothetical protein